MTRTVCPNCGAPWEGFRAVFPDGSSLQNHGVFLQHNVSNCCGCSEEYIAKLEASPTVALSVRLAEIEYSAKRGVSIPPADVLDLITELRRYMAFAEEVKGCTDRSLDRLEAALAANGGHE